jgi:hypothetical protein
VLNGLEEAVYKYSFKTHTIAITVKGRSVTFTVDGLEVPAEKYIALKQFFDETVLPAEVPKEVAEQILFEKATPVKVEEAEAVEEQIPSALKAVEETPPTPPGWVVRGRKALDPSSRRVYNIRKGRWNLYAPIDTLKKVAEMLKSKSLDEASKALGYTSKTTREYYRVYNRFEDVIEALKPVEKPVEKPAEKPVEKPAEKPKTSLAELLKKEVIG